MVLCTQITFWRKLLTEFAPILTALSELHCRLFFSEYEYYEQYVTCPDCSCNLYVVCVGGTTAAPNAANHNHTPAGTFKRQNTVDSATIKENTARINSASAAVRPAAVKNTPLTGIEPCTSPYDTCENSKGNFFCLIMS